MFIYIIITFCFASFACTRYLHVPSEYEEDLKPYYFILLRSAKVFSSRLTAGTNKTK